MCIIVYKPKGKHLPDLWTLIECLSGNQDGIGYMAAMDNNVFIYKGFRKVSKLMRHIKRNVLNVEDTPIAIHFRHATSGLKDAGNCHPFPVCDNYDSMRKPIMTCDIGICHNGVFSVEDKANKNVSDTMVFIAGIVAPYIEAFTKENSLLADLVLHSNRILLMKKDGSVFKFGFWLEEDGIWYSNAGYKRIAPYHPPAPSVEPSVTGYQGSWTYARMCQDCTMLDRHGDTPPCKDCIKDDKRPHFERRSCGSCQHLHSTTHTEPCKSCAPCRHNGPHQAHFPKWEERRDEAAKPSTLKLLPETLRRDPYINEEGRWIVPAWTFPADRGYPSAWDND